ncbi:hypothetical protein PMAYCL1PPCAC_16120, partial [Pristionchus mayeri]
VLVLLDQRFDRVQRVSEYLIGEECLLLGHPVLGLVRVAVEQLQVHALLVQDATLLPQSEQSCLLLGELLQLALDVVARADVIVEQLLAGVGRLVERVLAGIDLALVLLVSLEERLRSGNVLCQLVRRDDRLHVIHPRDEVSVVGEEAMEGVALVESLLAIGCRIAQLVPRTTSLIHLGQDGVLPLGVRLQQSLRLLLQLAHLALERSEITFGALMLALECLDVVEVAAEVIGGERCLLLSDPRESLVRVAIESLNLVCPVQVLLSRGGKRRQTMPRVVNLVTLLVDLLRLLVAVLDQLACCLLDLHYMVLVVGELLEEVVELALQHLHVFQIHTHVFDRDERLLVSDPVEHFVALANELEQLECLSQLLSLVLQLEQQLVPQRVQLLQALL